MSTVEVCDIPMAAGGTRRVPVGTVVETTEGVTAYACADGFCYYKDGGGIVWPWGDEYVTRVFVEELHEPEVDAEAEVALADVVRVLEQVRDRLPEPAPEYERVPEPNSGWPAIVLDQDGDLWRVEGGGRYRAWNGPDKTWSSQTDPWGYVKRYGPLEAASTVDLDAGGVPGADRPSWQRP